MYRVSCRRIWSLFERKVLSSGTLGVPDAAIYRPTWRHSYSQLQPYMESVEMSIAL